MSQRSARSLACSTLLAAVLVAGCDSVCDDDRMPTCDIREEACQDTVIAAVQCLRGATVAERPPVTVVTPAEFEAELRAGADPMMMRTLQWEGVLHQLGVLAPEVSLFEAEVESTVASVAAYFSPTENAVFVIDRGEPMDSPDVVAVLLHEMVHAAQHQEHDLAARLAAIDSHEDLIRTRLAIEGEATFYQLEARAWAEGYRAEQLLWEDFFDDAIMNARTTLDSTSSPYFVVYGTLPYVLGSRYATAQWQAGDDAAVREVLAMPPSSSAFMRNPWLGEAPPPERLEASPCAPPPAPDGFEPSFQEEMGPQLIYAFLRADRRMSHSEAWGIAYRWRRDDLHVYSAPDGRVALAWRIHMSDTSGPRWTATEAEARGMPASATDEVVTLLAGDGPEVDAWTWDASPPGCAFP